MTSSKFIFVTRDNDEIQIPPQFCDKIAFIKNFVDTYEDVKKIQIPSNAPKTGKEQLEIIIKFLETLEANKAFDEEFDKSNQPGDETNNARARSNSLSNNLWIKNFFDKYQRYQLFDAIESANFLGVIDFVDPLAEYIAQKITQIKSTDEMTEFFGYPMEEEMKELFEKFVKENEKAHQQQKEKEEKEALKMKEEEEKRLKAEEAWSEALNEPDAKNDDNDDDIGLP